MKKWEKYDGKRKKKTYDIQLKDGKIFPFYWPNGDAWLPMSGYRVHRRHTDDEVAFIRESDHHWLWAHKMAERGMYNKISAYIKSIWELGNEDY